MYQMLSKYIVAVIYLAYIVAICAQVKHFLVGGGSDHINGLLEIDETEPVLVSFFNISLDKLSLLVDVEKNLDNFDFARNQTAFEPSFHRLDEDCDLWWPLNNSEIHLLSRAPLHLDTMKVQQRLILSCRDNIKYKTVLVQNIDASRCNFRENTFACLDQPSGFEFALKSYHIEDSGAVRLSYAVEHGSSLNDIAELLVIILDERLPIREQMSKATHIVLHKHYAAELAPYSNIFHPWVSMLESRDDLGYALASFLPHARSVVEVGVSLGNYAHLLLRTAPQLQFYLGVDSYKQWGEAYVDIANAAQDQQQGNFLAAMARLSVFGDRAHILRLDSITASRLVIDESVDLIYIDAMHHYRAVLADLAAWWPKVKPCGLLAGHDFLVDVLHDTVFTVKPAVLEFARKLRLTVFRTCDYDEYPAYPTWFIFKPCATAA
eukprot:gene33383-40387_t